MFIQRELLRGFLGEHLDLGGRFWWCSRTWTLEVCGPSDKGTHRKIHKGNFCLICDTHKESSRKAALSSVHCEISSSPPPLSDTLPRTLGKGLVIDGSLRETSEAAAPQSDGQMTGDGGGLDSEPEMNKEKERDLPAGCSLLEPDYRRVGNTPGKWLVMRASRFNFKWQQSDWSLLCGVFFFSFTWMNQCGSEADQWTMQSQFATRPVVSREL